MKATDTPIHIRVDPTNPGQFFACCGLLELADRAFSGARGGFSLNRGQHSFHIATEGQCDTNVLLRALSSCPITSTLTHDELSRLKVLLNKSKGSLTAAEKEDKAKLSSKWNRERIHLGNPFDIWIDWWNDELAGGARFKTWAGKQLVWELLDGLQTSLRNRRWESGSDSGCLFEGFSDGNLPLYFDADIGGHSSSIDVGFSLDALSIRASTRPLIELAAFVGLQRFRPRFSEEVISYCLWSDLLPPLIASTAAVGILSDNIIEPYAFRLLFRSKYLKSFLPAHRAIQHP